MMMFSSPRLRSFLHQKQYGPSGGGLPDGPFRPLRWRCGERTRKVSSCFVGDVNRSPANNAWLRSSDPAIICAQSLHKRTFADFPSRMNRERARPAGARHAARCASKRARACGKLSPRGSKTRVSRKWPVKAKPSCTSASVTWPDRCLVRNCGSASSLSR